ncbi:quinone oxidoreductase [Dongia sp.]|uniref:quinone oxidoreductase family protein n=1 Tax=Dongia sp. TaxID=1977262 RepID=UPI0035B3448E
MIIPTETNAIRFHQTGGPEVLKWETVKLGAPNAGEVTLRNRACGLNFIDTYHRSGLYPVPLPSGIGLEGAGIVEALGPGVTSLKVGDRVAYSAAPLGAYSEWRNYPADKLVKIPDSIDFNTAAAMMLQGMTVEYLIRRTYTVKPGDWVLFHAAAGGVGSIAVQWLKHLGAIVIGTAGGAEKCAIVKSLGADHVIDYRAEAGSDHWVKRVKDITGGKGVNVVYDGVGKDTCIPSMDCLKPRGYLVTFGNASGPVPPIEPLLLSQKGSLFLTRPTLMAYTATRADLELSANALIDVVAKGAVRIRVGHTYALKDAEQAQRDLEARKTTGSVVLLP